MDEYIKREDALDAVLFALVGTGLQSTAIYSIREVPTADVVPKSEVERLKLEYENLVRNLFMELDIACTTDGHLVFCSYGRFAKIKKKYTEGKT